jgi:hypothetical protein
MGNMGGMGKLLLILGGAIVLLGLVFLGGERLGLGRLPGDLHFSRRGFQVWIPITSALLLSLVLTVLLNLFRR